MAEAVLELDITPALAALDDLNTAFDGIATGFADELVTAIANVSDQLDAALSLPDTLAAQAEQLGNAITSALDGVITDALTPQITDVESQLAGVGADISDALNINTTPLEDAATNIGDVTDAITGGLAPASAGLSQDLQGTEIATTGLEASTALLEGSAGSLLKTVAPGAAIFAGIGAAVGDLVSKADAAEIATKRMNDVFGAEAPKVFNDRLSGLSFSLGELNAKAGGVNSELQQSVATFGQTAIGAGATKEQAGQVSQRMGELATIVTTLNPKLGTANDIFTLISRGLGGSARILQRYGITIDTVAQSHLALANAQENGRAKANLFDKQVAGSQLALQALDQQAKDNGTTLQQELVKGLDTSTIKFREFKASIEEALTRIGKPLVQPVLDIVQALEPAFISLAEAVGKVLAAVLPALKPIADALSEVIKFLTPVIDLFARIPKPVLEAVAAFLALKEATKLLTSLGGGNLGILGDFLSGLSGKAVAAKGSVEQLSLPLEEGVTKANQFGSSIGDLGNKLLGITIGVGIGMASLHDFGSTVQGTIGTIGGFAAAGAQAGSIFGPWGTGIGAVVGALGGLTAGLLAGGESLDEYHKHFQDLGTEIQKQGLIGFQAFKKFVDQLGDTDRAAAGLDKLKGFTIDLRNATLQYSADGTKASEVIKRQTIDYHALVNEIGNVARTNPTAAAGLLETLTQLTDEQGKSYFETQRGVKGYLAIAQAIDDNAKVAVKAKIASEEQAQKNQALEDQLKATKLATDDQTQATYRYITAVTENNKVIDDLTKKFTTMAPTISDVWTEADKIAQAFGNGQVDIKGFAKALQVTIDTGQDFSNNLRVLIDHGFGALAAEIAAKGPEAGGQIAKQLADGINSGQPDATLATADLMNHQVIEIQARAAAIPDIIKGVIGGQISGPFATEFKAVEETTANEFDATYVQMANGQQKLVGKSSDIAKAVAAQFVAGLTGGHIDTATEKILLDAGIALNNSTLPTKADEQGQKAGKAHGDGTVKGITSKKADIAAAAANSLPTEIPPAVAEKGKAAGQKYAGSIATGITDTSSGVSAAAADVIPKGGIGAEDWGHTIGDRYGSKLAEGIRGRGGDIHDAARSVIPTGGLGAEDWGHTVGVRYGTRLADGIREEGGVVHDAAHSIIPTGGLGAEDWGHTIGVRFGNAMASGMYDSGDVVFKAGQFLARMAAAGAAAGGSPSEHLFIDLGTLFSKSLALGMERSANVVYSAAQKIVNTASKAAAFGVPALMESPTGVGAVVDRQLSLTTAVAQYHSSDQQTSLSHHMDKSITVAEGAIQIVTPQPEQAGEALIRKLRDVRFLGGV